MSLTRTLRLGRVERVDVGRRSARAALRCGEHCIGAAFGLVTRQIQSPAAGNVMVDLWELIHAVPGGVRRRVAHRAQMVDRSAIVHKKHGSSVVQRMWSA